MSKKMLNLLLGCMLVAAATSAQEQSIGKKNVPKAVVETFRKSYPNATIKGYAKEVDEGKTVYEIESTEGNVHRDVTYAADGILQTIEESLPFSDLPEPVRNTITKEYPKGKISISEKVIKGSTTQFEVLVKSTGRKYELVLNGDGTLVKKETK